MADTPISPASGSVTASGVAAAMAMSLMIAPGVGAWSTATAAPGLTSGTSTVITPSAGGATLAGVAPTLTSATSTVITPTVGGVTLAGVASSVLPVNQTLSSPGTAYLLTNAAASGTYQRWPGGIGVFSAVGTWAGASVSLQFLGPDNVTMLAFGAATTLTANGAGIFYAPKCTIQAVVTNAGATTSITAAAQIVPSPISGIAS